MATRSKLHLDSTPGCLSDSSGMVLIVTNDYADSKAGTPLLSTHKDGESMMSTFRQLNFSTTLLKNVNKSKILKTVDDLLLSVADEEISKEFVIAFVFSGHGGEKDTLLMQDGLVVSLNSDIVQPFIKCKKLAKYPKLFFIDACRGSGDTDCESMTKSTLDLKSQSEKEYSSPECVSLDGNYYIAYATISRKKSFLKNSLMRGSVWMQRLALQLKKNESVQNIVSTTNKLLWEDYRSKDNTQQPDGYSTLNCGPLYLRPKSPFSPQNKTFRVYKLSDEDLPSSIPLVIPPGYTYDSTSYSIQKEPHQSEANFVIAQKAIDLIRAIDKPVAVLGICGPYRSGKSFFLTRLLGKKAFKIGHTAKACTRGVWLSTNALICEEFVLLLIDSEGTNAVGDGATKDQTSLAILTLTNLLSSFLIYNSRGVPDKNDLENISMFGDLSVNINVRQTTIQDEMEIQEYLPAFCWLFRDIPESYIPEGLTAATNYIKENVLQHSRLGETLLSMYPDLHCYPLPHPGCKPPLTLIEQNLGDDFIQKFKCIAEYILKAVKPKMGFSLQPIEGSTLACVFEQYIVAINSPAGVPNLEECWKNSVQHNLTESVEKLIKLYHSEMEEALSGKYPVEYQGTKNSLLEIHRTILQKKVLFPFKKKCAKLLVQGVDQLTLDEDYQASEKTLHKRIAVFEEGTTRVVNGALLEFVRENEDVSYSECGQIFISLCPQYTPLDLEDVRKKYFAKAVGPEKDRVFDEKFRDIPGPPKDIEVVEVTHSEAVLQWTQPQGSEGVTLQYQVHVDSKDTTMETDKPSIVLSNLYPLKSYLIKIHALSGRLLGLGVEISFTTKAGPPNKPALLDVAASKENLSEMTISYRPPTSSDKNGSKITKAIVRYGEMNSNEALETAECSLDSSSNCIKIKLSNVTSTKVLKIQVSFVNEVGEGEAADTLFDTKYMVPGKPENFIASGRGHERIKLRWGPPLINPGSVERYVIHMRPMNQDEFQIIYDKDTTKSLSAVAKCLDSDAMYNFEITAHNSAKQGTSTGEFKTWIETKYHPAIRATMVSGAAVGGTLAAPFIAAGAATVASVVAIKKGIGKKSKKQVAAGSLGVVAAPVTTVGGFIAGTVGAPIIGGTLAKKAYDQMDSDSDLEDSDNETDKKYTKRKGKEAKEEK